MRKLAGNIIGWLICLVFGAFKKYPRHMNWYFHDPSPELFEFLVRWGYEHHYKFINIQECIDLLSSGNCSDEKTIFLSFDDAWKSNMNLLSVCEKYCAPITIFVAIKPMEEGNYWWEYAEFHNENLGVIKKMDYEIFCKKVNELKLGVKLNRSAISKNDFDTLLKNPLVSLQSHTISHPILTNCPDEVLEYEVFESKSILEHLTGGRTIAFCYPNGDVSLREKDAAQRAGYKIAFTTEQRELRIPEKDMFLIPRMSINSFGGNYENLARAFGLFTNLTRIKHIFQC